MLDVALLLLLILFLMNMAMPKFKIMQTLVDRLNLVSREILTGIMPVRAFSREQFEEQRFDKANKDLMGTQLFTNRAMVAMMPFMTLIMNGTSLLIVWFGGKAMDDGTMQVGEMIAFITYTMQIVMSFLMLAMVAVMLPRAGVAADRIDEVIRTKATIHDPDEADAKAAKEHKNWQGVVEFHDVSFRFPGADSDALEHISFTAKPGETTAIIGSTGCGKIHPAQPDPPLLRRDRRQRDRGRHRRAPDAPGTAARPAGLCAPEGRAVQRHHRQQPEVRRGPHHRRRREKGRCHRTGHRVHRRKAGGLRKPHCTGRFQCVRRPETAPVHCPRHCQGPQNLSVRRQLSRPWTTRPTWPCAAP